MVHLFISVLKRSSSLKQKKCLLWNSNFERTLDNTHVVRDLTLTSFYVLQMPEWSFVKDPHPNYPSASSAVTIKVETIWFTSGDLAFRHTGTRQNFCHSANISTYYSTENSVVMLTAVLHSVLLMVERYVEGQYFLLCWRKSNGLNFSMIPTWAATSLPTEILRSAKSFFTNHPLWPITWLLIQKC